jgi:cytochrome c5
MANLTDPEMRAAVLYMFSAGGAGPSAPAVAAAAAGASAPPKVLAPGTGGKPDGAKIYAAGCNACHAAGVAGAPKFGDKAAWAPRIAQGKDALYNSALHGKNAMPPKGGSSAPDADVKAAVDYMVNAAK